jgi:hypothetical protein
MNKKFDFIINKMKIPQIVAEEVMDYCKEHGTDKYAVWIAREANKVSDFNYQELNKIMDWAHSVRPNILSLSFEDAKQKSDEWHNNLEKNSTKEFAKRLSLDEKRIMYKTLDKKHFFYLLIPSELKYEGEYMGHCIGTNPFYSSRLRKKEIQILSLRDENNLPHVTIEMILQHDGLLRTGQISGKGNQPPIDKYQNMITEYGIYLISQKENQDFKELMKLMKLI